MHESKLKEQMLVAGCFYPENACCKVTGGFAPAWELERIDDRRVVAEAASHRVEQLQRLRDIAKGVRGPYFKGAL